MDKTELQKNEIKNPTFVEKHEGEISVEAVSKGPEVFVEEKGVEVEKESDVKTKNIKKDQKPVSEEKGLGYEIEDIDENFNEITDYSDANKWRSALKDKRAA
jgi:hypothetical protein